MLGLWPWKLLRPKVAVNKPTVDWCNAVTRALTTMTVRMITTDEEPGIDRTNTDGTGWAIEVPEAESVLPEAEYQYQVLTADSDLEWVADWVRAHG